MATGKITKRSVDAMSAGGSDVFLWDDELRGFGLKVTPAGRKSYVYQYRIGGREARTKRWTIGGHGNPWTPATARDEAERLAKLVGQGVDPVDADKKRRKEAVELAFNKYVETFATGYLEPEWGSSWQDAKRQLELHVVPTLGSKALPQIDKTDLNEVFDKLRSQPAVHRNVYAVTRKLFGWAETRDDIERTPFAKMKAPAGAKARKRILSADELRALWEASFKLEHPRGHFIRLLMATLQRRSEVAEMPWSEILTERGLWHLPGTRTKNSEDHLVPLSPFAMEIIESLGIRKRGLAFPSSTGKTSISNFSDVKTALDKEMLVILQRRADEAADDAGEDRHEVELPAWRLHDIRRTGTTQLQQLGFSIEINERVINHHQGGSTEGIKGVYNLYEYLPEKEKALAAWGAWLAQVVSDAKPVSNVVQLAERRV